MKLKNLTDLFIFELRAAYDAEAQLTRAMPPFVAALNDENLKKACDEYMRENAHHISRIDEIFDILGLSHKGETNTAMQALIQQTQDVLKNAGDDRALNAALIASLQKIGHYTIASYGTLVALARELGYDNAVFLLKQTVEEEKTGDEKLTALAQGGINHDALKRAA